MANTSRSTGKPMKSARELAERIDRKLRAMKLHSGADEWDPVEAMAVVGADAFKKGDDMLAVACYKEVARYVRPSLKPKEMDDEDPHKQADDKKQRAAALLMQHGIALPEHLKDMPAPYIPDHIQERIAISGDTLEPDVEDAEVIEE